MPSYEAATSGGNSTIPIYSPHRPAPPPPVTLATATTPLPPGFRGWEPPSSPFPGQDSGNLLAQLPVLPPRHPGPVGILRPEPIYSTVTTPDIPPLVISVEGAEPQVTSEISEGTSSEGLRGFMTTRVPTGRPRPPTPPRDRADSASEGPGVGLLSPGTSVANWLRHRARRARIVGDMLSPRPS